MISSVVSGIRWTTIVLLPVCLFGLAVTATIVLSLISTFLPNKGEGLARSTLCQISFAPMVSQAVGIAPAFTTSGDFNNDNVLDLAVVNYDDSTMSVLLGNGNGGFNQQIKFSTGNGAGPNGVAVGDLNHDKKLDMVVVNADGGNVAVFLGQGNGTFQQKATLSTGTNSAPLGLTLGDLNTDNILDLVVSDGANNVLLIFPGNGDGTFIQTYTLSTGTNSRPYSIVINYFNKDNHLDIAVGNGLGNNISIFFGDGTGNFGEQKTFSTGSGSFPFAIRSGDFNGDNKQDLIVANSGTDNVGILLGYGNGKFKSIKIYSTGSGSGPDDVLVDDFNGDNRLDFISANANNNTIGIFLSTCS